MKLDFTECNHLDEGLFADFAKFGTVDKYLQAVVDVIKNDFDYLRDNAPRWVPLNLAVKDSNTGEFRWIVCAGQVRDDAENHIAWVRRQPARIRHFLSDDIIIKGDGFESELYISWN